MFPRSLFGVFPTLCFVTACAGGAPQPDAPPSRSPGSPTTARPGDEGSAPPPTVPPKRLERTDAFYIISIPAPVSGASATVCADSADCDALLPANPPTIVHRFTEESWVVIKVPASFTVKNVVSDQTTATATLDHACPGSESKLVLYRVAKSVTKAVVDVPASPPNCSKAK